MKVIILAAGTMAESTHTMFSPLYHNKEHYFYDDNPKLSFFKSFEEMIRTTKDNWQLNNTQFIFGNWNPKTKISFVNRLFGYSNVIRFPTLNLSEQTVKPYVYLKSGILISKDVLIETEATIGNYVCINYKACIGHHTKIGEFTTIAPGAIINGCVEIGSGCFIGSGAIIIPKIKIGDNVTVGAGSVIIKDIPDNCTVVGNPGRIIKYE
jgi:sugar O-acyltransferase (sialic acid O-acetyltransferase NeuD family)